VREIRIETARGAFSALADGPEAGPLALCLHGFPDSAWTWRHLVPQLASAGYLAVAPFMRGYAPTGPVSDGDYSVDALAADANALHEKLGGARPGLLIGHDWGAAAVYGAVGTAPERWRQCVALAVPLTGGVAVDLYSHEQMRRSWYSYLFQLPVGEAIAARDDLALVDRLWRDWSPSYEAGEDVSRAKDALRPPGHLAAALAYYRATPSELREERPNMIETPLLYLHGRDDGCIGADVVDAARSCFPAGTQIEIIDGAGHFVQLEAPERVAALVLGFAGPADASTP
jgi:pimeloyl-ACP methyl ester carboxylesterase